MVGWEHTEDLDYEQEQGNEHDTGGALANRLCTATTAAGNPCFAPAVDGVYCRAHSPEYAEERKLVAMKGGLAGGRGRPGSATEYSHIKIKIQGLTEQVLNGTLDTKIAFAANALLNSYLRALKEEREATEREELLARLEELEESLGDKPRWVT